MILTSLFLLLLSNGLTIRKDVSILCSRIAIAILICSILSTYGSFYVNSIEKGISLYNGLFNITNITSTFQGFIFLVSLIILLLTGFYPRKVNNITYIKENVVKKVYLIINKMAEQFTIVEYALIILFVIIGGTLLLSSGDFVSLFLCIELQSYGLYIICVLYKESESSTNSGLTYFLLGSLASCFILLGISLIYSNSGITSLDGFYSLTNISLSLDQDSEWYKSKYIKFSLLIFSVGMLFKVAGAPFHFWAPDVYDGVPTIVTTFIALLPKISILVFMLDLIHYTSETSTNNSTFDWTSGIMISSLLSLIIGTILGLSQTRIKRLFAYSTISHLGFLLLALSVNTIESSKAFIFYLIQYTLTNLNAFIILITIGFSLYLYYNDGSENYKLKDKINSPIQLITQIKGYFYVNPSLALCLAIVMLSFIGLPPLVGFFAKQIVLSSALDNGFVFLVLIGVLTSVIGAVYYLGIIKTMFFDESDYKKSHIEFNVSLTDSLTSSISILSLGVLFFILIPNEILNISDILALISFTDTIHLDNNNNNNDEIIRECIEGKSEEELREDLIDYWWDYDDASKTKDNVEDFFNGFNDSNEVREEFSNILLEDNAKERINEILDEEMDSTLQKIALIENIVGEQER